MVCVILSGYVIPPELIIKVFSTLLYVIPSLLAMIAEPLSVNNSTKATPDNDIGFVLEALTSGPPNFTDFGWTRIVPTEPCLLIT